MDKLTSSQSFNVTAIHDGESAPYYTLEWYAWANVASTSSATTEPSPNSGWSQSIASQGSYSYLWKKIIRYEWVASSRTYVQSSGYPQYFRMTGTSGTSINTKGTVVAVESSSSSFPSGSSGDLAIVITSAYLYKSDGSTWTQQSTAASDGDAYVNEGDRHLWQWNSEAAKWIDLGLFQGENGKTYYSHVAWATSVTLSSSSLPTPDGQLNQPNATAVTGFSISPSGTTYEWMGILIDENSGQDSSNSLLYTWSYTKGAQGEQGDPAWSIIASPSPLIINQSLLDTSDFGLPIAISFTGYYGDTAATLGTTTNISNDLGLTISGTSGGLSITAYSKVSGAYVTSGQITCTVPLSCTVNGTTHTTSIVVHIAVAVNMIGTWEETIVEDTKTEVATDLMAAINGSTTTVFSTVGTYIRSSKESISKLEKVVETNINLLPSVTSGWEGPSGAEDDVTYDTDYKIECDDLYSPVVVLEPNTTYCFSATFGNTSGLSGQTYYGLVDVMSYTHNYEVYDAASTAQTLYQPTWQTSSNNRMYFTFTTGDSRKMFVFNYYSDDYPYLNKPQLEVGTLPTAFCPKIMAYSSQIKQTAESIKMEVSDDLKSTGINIETGVITLDAEKTVVTGNLQSKSVQTEDSAGNKIVIEGGKFNVYNTAGTVGLSIGWDDDGNPYLLVSNAAGTSSYKFTYEGQQTSNNYSSDVFTNKNYLLLVNGTTAASSVGASASSYTQYYYYTAAQNPTTGVYLNDTDGTSAQREAATGLTFTDNTLSDILSSPNSYLISDGYYVSDFLTLPPSTASNIHAKTIYKFTDGIATSAGVIYLSYVGSTWYYCDEDGANETSTLVLSNYLRR